MPNLLEDLEIGEVSIVDEPANKQARVVLLKSAERDIVLKGKEAIYEAIEKLAFVQFPGDNRADAVAKFLQTSQGGALYGLYETAQLVDKAADANVSTDRVAANLILETRASTIRKSDPSLSPEQAYVKAMDEMPDVAATAVG